MSMPEPWHRPFASTTQWYPVAWASAAARLFGRYRQPRLNKCSIPTVEEIPPAAILVDVGSGFSTIATVSGLPSLIRAAKSLAIGVMAVRNGCHSSGL